MCKITLRPLLIACGIAAIGIFIITKASTMGFLGKLCMFSSVEGVVLQNGEPVAEAVVTREYEWQDTKKSDQTVTDASGKFSFPARFEYSLLSVIIPHSPSISQDIVIEVNGKSYEAWYFHKIDYEVNGELEGKKMIMACELSKEPELHKITDSISYSGLCELKL